LREPIIKIYWRLLIDVSLILLTLVGGVFAVQSGWQRYSLFSQITRTEKRIGSFPISYPKLAHIHAFETENPLKFAWRIYLPAKDKMTRVQRSSSSSSFSSGISLGNPTEMIAMYSDKSLNHVCKIFAKPVSLNTDLFE